MTDVVNRLRPVRESRGFSASDLAQRAGVSRQTIYSIEEGTFLPNTAIALKLARILDVTVEELFSFADEEPGPEIVRADLLDGAAAPPAGELVRVCSVNGRPVAVPSSPQPAYLPTADGIVRSSSGRRVQIETAAPFAAPEDALLLAGCDIALSLVVELLRASRIEVLALPCSSVRAITWLKKGQVHVAGAHLLDRKANEYNLPAIRKHFPQSETIRVVTFASWELGLVVRTGNPHRIRSIADLGRKNVSIVNREQGSGVRDLLNFELRQAGIEPASVRGYNRVAHGHLEAALAVLSGSADCCLAPRAAARSLGLDFIPIAVQRFDLALKRSSLDQPAVQALLDVLNRSVLRRKLQLLAGYDTTQTGKLLM